jgi:hypothetical protein
MKAIATESNITLIFSNGNSTQIVRSDPNYFAILNKLLNKETLDETEYEDLCNPSKYLEKASNGKLRIHEGQPQLKIPNASCDGSPVWRNIDPEVHDRLEHFVSERMPLDPFINFYEKLNDNPSFNSRKQLFNFIANREMPVTPDGYVLGYKGVNHDYSDKHSGDFDNSVGETIGMERNQVDDNPDNSCSRGFHIGSHSYANSWRGCEGKLMLVKFNPSDAVSVPNDGCDKLRVCKYTVVADISNRPHALTSPCYTTDGGEINTIDRAVEIADLNYSEPKDIDIRIAQARCKLTSRLIKGRYPKVDKFLYRQDLDYEALPSICQGIADTTRSIDGEERFTPLSVPSPHYS